MAELNTTVNRSIMLETYNQSNIEQLSRSSVRIRHNDKCVKHPFFVVPGDGSVLLEIHNIELPSTISYV